MCRNKTNNWCNRLFVILTVFLVSCQASAPTVVTKDVVVTQIVEKIVEKVVEKVVVATEIPASAAAVRPLSIAMVGKLEAFHPLNTACSYACAEAKSLIYDTLFMVGPYDTIIPRLAESWDISADAKTYTFHLRKGLKWSDGKPFSSKDVLMTFNLIANPDTKSWAPLFVNVIGAADVKDKKSTTVSGFTAPDADTFVVSLETPDSEMLSNWIFPILYIMPEHIVGSKQPSELLKDPWFLAPTSGMGPYKFVKWEPAQYLEVERNANYWRPVNIERVLYREMDPNVAVAALISGEIDLMKPVQSDRRILDVTKDITVVSKAESGITMIIPFHESPPFDDVRVRQAFLHAIDRQGLINSVFEGHGTIVNSHMRIAKYLPNDLIPYEYNPEKAKQLLKEANYDFKFEFKTTWNNKNKIRNQIGPIIAANLRAVGVNAVEAPGEGSLVLEEIGKRTYSHGIYIGGGIYTVGPGAIEQVMGCTHHYPGGENFAHNCNEEIDRLFLEAKNSTDEKVKMANYQQIARLDNAAANYLWILALDLNYAFSKRLKGFEATSNPSDSLGNISDWTLAP